MVVFSSLAFNTAGALAFVAGPLYDPIPSVLQSKQPINLKQWKQHSSETSVSNLKRGAIPSLMVFY